MGRQRLNIVNNLLPSTLRNRYSVLLGTTRGIGSAVRINNYVQKKPLLPVCNVNNWEINNLGDNNSLFWERVALSYDGRVQTAVIYDGNIYNSYDYGNTWQPNKQNFNFKWLSVSMNYDGQYQTALAETEHIYTSNDYGKTWQPNTETPNNVVWTSVSMSSSGQYQTAVINGFINLSEQGDIYTSNDYGKTWQISLGYNNCWTYVAVSNNGQHQTAVSFFVDSITVPNSNMGFVFNSNDYGKTWKKNTSLGLSYYTCVGMSGNGKLQVIGVNNCNPAPTISGPLFISYDYGNTFVQTTSPFDAWLNISINNIGNVILASSYQQSNNDGTIVPDTGKMMVSYDYGISWQQTNASLNTWTSAIISKNGCFGSASAWGSGLYRAIK
jgi:photosystem II stability/assembly factor-like uncharacterized protein